MPKHMTVQQLREAFAEFFRGRDHLIMPSAPLVLDDPTTLFTSAGMQPYIAAFRGEEDPPAPRVASIQKCARTGDLENVGRYNRYHTFFEMLGNFSFGDYFKKEAIEWAWEFVTDPNWMGLDPADLWITIYETDDEAFEIWHKHIGVPADRILRFGRKDNWWPQVRWEGPCGPCTEIHVDLGPEVGCGKPDCGVGCDCDRFLELWNLVFQMYVEHEDGTLEPLPKPGVDTGMGLERLALVMQGKRFTFETDELWHILQAVQREINAQREQPYQYGQDFESDVALRVITDHLRAVAFMMADGAVPSNEGAGYVMRRLIRRSLRFARRLGATEAFMHRALPAVAEAMAHAYPELLPKQEFAQSLLKSEEERFLATLEQGMQRFEDVVERLRRSGEKVISGRDAFVLYDTFGFPLEMTMELAAERGLEVDVEGFEAAMEEQRARSAAGARGLALHGDADLAARLPETEFVGYETLSADATIVAIIRGEEQVESAGEGDEVGIVLDRTPFYAEAGGQVGDTGVIEADGARFEVSDTVPLGEAHLHLGRVISGRFEKGMAVTAQVDEQRRWHIMRHHTATHLLQAALRQVLGEHVSQAGSLVAPDRLRFDFTHHEALTEEQIEHVERLVNEWTVADIEVQVEEVPLQEALDRGAIALFGEKYGETVRLVQVPGVSMELCGGTHVQRTGQIGAFRIIDQSSVAAGIRRVEAVAGLVAVERDRQVDKLVDELVRRLNCPRNELLQRVEALQRRIEELQEEVKRAKQMRAAADVGKLLEGARKVGDVTVVAAVVPGLDREALANLADELVARGDNVAAVLGAEVDGKAAIVCKLSDELVKRGLHAGQLAKQIAAECGGGGGGRPNFAQAGGSKPENLQAAIEKAVQIVSEALGGDG